ncbi:hypothetical protein [Lysobacter gummosus]|uniref:hypothetical protein n=1 Tax=Lysobacter gummosus TaxID=262324 RepID=UPI00362CCACA
MRRRRRSVLRTRRLMPGRLSEGLVKFRATVFCSSFPRTRESSAFRARAFEVTGFPRSRE